MTRDSSPYASAQDMAHRFKISDDSVRRKVQSGEWPCDRIGRLYRFSPEQQEEIALIVSGEKDSGFDKNRIAAALNALSA